VWNCELCPISIPWFSLERQTAEAETTDFFLRCVPHSAIRYGILYDNAHGKVRYGMARDNILCGMRNAFVEGEAKLVWNRGALTRNQAILEMECFQ
jgi:hypothetical protein